MEATASQAPQIQRTRRGSRYLFASRAITSSVEAALSYKDENWSAANLFHLPGINRGVASCHRWRDSLMKFTQHRKPALENSEIISRPIEDGIDRRDFLSCMAWAGAGLVWTMAGGVPSSRLLFASATRQMMGSRGTSDFS